MGSIEEGAYPRNNTKRKRRNALKLHKKGMLRSRIVFLVIFILCSFLSACNRHKPRHPKQKAVSLRERSHFIRLIYIDF